MMSQLLQKADDIKPIIRVAQYSHFSHTGQGRDRVKTLVKTCSAFKRVKLITLK